MRRLGIALTGALALAGCSNVPSNMVVLLDQPDGRPSAVTFTSAQGTTVVDKPGFATGTDKAGEKPKEPFLLEKEELDRRFGATLAARPEPPVSFNLYFKFESTDLTEESKAELPRIIATMKQRPAPEISIVGHTDQVGAQEFNYALGLKRALAVKTLIEGIGVDPTRIDVTSYGKRLPLVPVPDGTAEPRNRRVEVAVR
jgi:outer membrane protein OmpA-like peptidoglycan-associated protein